MTTVLLLAMAGAVVAWLVRRAGSLDVRDETDRFARVQDVVSRWSAEPRAQSDNDLSSSPEVPGRR